LWQLYASKRLKYSQSRVSNISFAVAIAYDRYCYWISKWQNRHGVGSLHFLDDK
jgi:hypothetical protein